MPNNMSYTLWLKPGAYFWCSCGKSQTAPFCDSSHGSTGKKPLEFVVNSLEEVSLCGCGKTIKPPYCDGSHTK